eukprot:Skav215820  [mRNA]  locus=scaffold3449:190589:191113:+ [translate_table: standard]
MAPVVKTELMHHMHRAVKDEDVEVLKGDLGLSDQEIHDMMKILVKDNQWSDSLFHLGLFFIALAAALSGIGAYIFSRYNSENCFNTAITFFGLALLWTIFGLCAFILSGFMKRFQEENPDAAAQKLNHCFPQLRFTISKKKVKGCCGPIETGWQLVVEARHGETAGVETIQSGP